MATGLKPCEYPKDLCEIARRRITLHLQNLARVDYDLRQLAMNCYLQGVHDTAEALAARGWAIPTEEPNDYQI